MTAPSRAGPRRAPLAQAWIPRQHGAWAMLLMPIVLGLAASRPSGWQLVLTGAALSGYLASSTLQAWARARRAPTYRVPLVVFVLTFAILATLLAITFPGLLLVAVVVVPSGIVVFRGARPGTRRDLANSLAQVAQALALVPAAAYVSGDLQPARVVTAVLVAAAYLFGSVFVVRSVLRERGNEPFAAGSLAFHVALVIAAAAWLPPAYPCLAGWLAIRAAALPRLQRRWASGPRPLRPVHVGIVEIVSSLAVAVVALAVPF